MKFHKNENKWSEKLRKCCIFFIGVLVIGYLILYALRII